MIDISRREALLVTAGVAAGSSVCRGESGVSGMVAVDFARSRISWTTRTGIDGSWRIVAIAHSQESSDCIYLAPAVMAGKVFGSDRLPLDPVYSFQLIARHDRHAIARDDEEAGKKDSEAENTATFSSFEISAPRRAAKSVDLAALNSRIIANLWPLSARLNVRDKQGKLWNLEFPINHIISRANGTPLFQIETGPILIPCDLIEIADASSIGGCYLAYAFLNTTHQVDLLAWGGVGQRATPRKFIHFARITNVKANVLSGVSE